MTATFTWLSHVSSLLKYSRCIYAEKNRFDVDDRQSQRHRDENTARNNLFFIANYHNSSNIMLQETKGAV